MVNGFNSVRILALMLITWQHAASVLGYYEVTQWRGISPGQVGVSMFCAISGFLAFHTQSASVKDWFVKRLIRIFPAYWLVTVGAFALALIGSNKEITFWLFISQMFGTGYFTHGWDLINIISWFISLLLLCYLFVAISLKSGWPKSVLSSIFLLALILCVSRFEVSLSRHVMTFALAGLLAHYGNERVVLIVAALMFFFGIVLDPQLFYSGIAVALLVVVSSVPVVDPACIRRAACYSYEYFLIHGILLVVMCRFIPNPWVGVSLAIVTAIIGSILLSKISYPFLMFLNRNSVKQFND